MPQDNSRNELALYEPLCTRILLEPQILHHDKGKVLIPVPQASSTQGEKTGSEEEICWGAVSFSHNLSLSLYSSRVNT